MISTDNLPPGPGALYDALDFASVTQSSGAVSQWSDKSGNARHMLQSTSGNKPSLVGGGISFDGSNDYLSCTTGLDMLKNVSGATIIACATSTVDTTGFKVLFAASNVNSNNNILSLRVNKLATSKDQCVVYSDNTSSSSASSPDPFVRGMKHLIMARVDYSGGSIYYYANNKYVTTGTVSPAQNTPNTNALSFVIGCRTQLADGFYKGNIHTIAVWPYLLTAEQGYNALHIIGLKNFVEPGIAEKTYLTVPKLATVNADLGGQLQIAGGSAPYYVGWIQKPSGTTMSLSGSTITFTTTGVSESGEILVSDSAGNYARTIVSVYGGCI